MPDRAALNPLHFVCPPNIPLQPRRRRRGARVGDCRRRAFVGCKRLSAGRRREFSQRRNDASLSPEGRPWSSPSTEMSSSSAGQWMPTPGPINSIRFRSRGEPWTSRGYHFSGTDTVRPSRSSTTSACPVTRADFASAVSIPRLEVLIRCLHQLTLVLTNDALDAGEFPRCEAHVVRRSQGREPELCGLVFSSDVHVNRFVPVACEKKNRYGPLRKTVGLTGIFSQVPPVASRNSSLDELRRRWRSRLARPLGPARPVLRHRLTGTPGPPVVMGARGRGFRQAGPAHGRSSRWACTCMSQKPGTMNWPRASTTVAPGGVGNSVSPTRATLPS
jgi:hypothetical protein